MQDLIQEARLVLRGRDSADRKDDFAQAVREGLAATPKSLPCRFFYDAEGSRLFERITHLEAYYPPQAEIEILEARAHEIVEAVPGALELVELGSGSGRKTRIVIDALLAAQGRLRYVPIDISYAALEASARDLLADHPDLSVRAYVGEYEEALAQLAPDQGRARLFLWLGSSIGNFTRPAAAERLRAVRAALGPSDRLLVGVDLRKSREVLERAYDDPEGVTARFNKNLLARMNRELGADVDLDRFRHVAVYREDEGRVEMHLESLADQQVHIPTLDLTVSFARGERIHTENSYKYSPREIEELAARGGLSVVAIWTDARERFAEVLLAPAG